MTNECTTSATNLEQEVNLLTAELELENEMEWASNVMEMAEIFEEARCHGTDYGSGFMHGFEKGIDFFLKKSVAREQSTQEKVHKLESKWGI